MRVLSVVTRSAGVDWHDGDAPARRRCLKMGADIGRCVVDAIGHRAGSRRSSTIAGSPRAFEDREAAPNLLHGSCAGPAGSGSRTGAATPNAASHGSASRAQSDSPLSLSLVDSRLRHRHARRGTGLDRGSEVHKVRDDWRAVHRSRWLAGHFDVWLSVSANWNIDRYFVNIRMPRRPCPTAPPRSPTSGVAFLEEPGVADARSRAGAAPPAPRGGTVARPPLRAGRRPLF